MFKDKKHKILILGASSKIAKYLIEILLKQGYQNITCISRSENKKDYPKFLKFKKLNNLEILDDLEKEISAANIIINLIGEYKKKAKMNLTNIEYIKCLCEKIKLNKNKQRLIHISSVSCYGYSTIFSRTKILINERSKDCPNCLYGLSKSKGDQIIKELKYINKKSFTIIRPTIIYDLKGSSKFINKLISISKLNLFFRVLDEKNYLNIIDIRDVSNILYRVINNLDTSKNQLFIASNDYMLKEYLNEIYKLFKINFIGIKNLEIAFLIFLKFIKFIKLTFLINNFLLIFYSKRSYSNKKLSKKLRYNPKFKIKNNLELQKFIRNNNSFKSL